MEYVGLKKGCYSYCWEIQRLVNRLVFFFFIFTNTSARAGYDTMSIFKRGLTGLSSELSFSKISCLTKAEEPSLPYYLPIAGGRIIGFIPFPRILVLCEMQSVSSRIWTRVTVSISYDDNHYTTGTSFFFFLPHSQVVFFLSVEAVKELRMEGKRQWYLLDSNFIFGVYNYSDVLNVFERE